MPLCIERKRQDAFHTRRFNLDRPARIEIPFAEDRELTASGMRSSTCVDRVSVATRNEDVDGLALMQRLQDAPLRNSPHDNVALFGPDRDKLFVVRHGYCHVFVAMGVDAIRCLKDVLIRRLRG
jgi:hypothetical protein